MIILKHWLPAASILLLLSCSNNNNPGKDGFTNHEMVLSVDSNTHAADNGAETGTEQDAVPDSDAVPDHSYDVNETGLSHGQACTEDKQCKYGICYASPNITGGLFKFCTKDCTKPTHDAVCEIDDTDKTEYTCIRWGTWHPEETISGYCVPICHNVQECKAIDDRYNACQMPGVGVYKVCMYKKGE